MLIFSITVLAINDNLTPNCKPSNKYCLTYGLKVFDNFIIFGFSSVLMLQSSMSSILVVILGFLATPFSSNRFSNGTNPFGMMLFFSWIMSLPAIWFWKGSSLLHAYALSSSSHQHSSSMFVLANLSLIRRNLST
jgi:hypothetical protein